MVFLFTFLLLLIPFRPGAELALPDVPAKDAATLEREGNAALDKQDFAEAERIFSALVTTHPQEFTFYFNLAVAQSSQNKDAAAIENFKKTLALKPGIHQAELNLGMVYLRSGNAEEAATHLREALRLKPGQARAQLYLAQSLSRLSKWDEAVPIFQEVLKADAKSADAELGLGQALLQQKKLDEAVPHFKQAVALDPSLKSFLLELASNFSKSDRNAEAIGLLTQFPEDAGACEELGRIYLAAHRPALAVGAFESAFKISSTPANRLALATAYIRNRQPDQASPLLQQALQENPNDYDVQLTVGRIHRDAKRYPDAARQFEAATKLKPDSVEAWNEFAGASVLAEQYPQAMAALDRLRQMKAETAGNLFLRAIVLDKFHQPEPALNSYRQFLSRSEGKNPDEEFKARQRIRILEKEVNRR